VNDLLSRTHKFRLSKNISVETTTILHRDSPVSGLHQRVKCSSSY
ncbi:methyl-accepting chemotaxis protein I, partial [Citrobacter sp. TBCS-14]